MRHDGVVTKKGRVIDLHAADGYGFVRTEDGVRYLFLIESCRTEGTEQPKAGSSVTVVVPRFCKAGRTPRIQELRLDPEQEQEQASAPLEAAPNAAGRLHCPHCGMWMTPRLFYSNGMLEGNLCPFCMKPYRVNEPLPEFGSPSHEQFWQALIVSLLLDIALKAVVEVDLNA